MKLTNTQRDYLRKQAHHLKPVVHVGKNGVSSAVIETVSRALDAHELIKVKLLDAQDEPKQLAEQGAAESHSALVHLIGNVATLYREQPDPEARTITLPTQSKA